MSRSTPYLSSEPQRRIFLALSLAKNETHPLKIRYIVIKAELAYTYQYYKLKSSLQRRIDQDRCSCQSKSSSVMRTKTNCS
jgi:hypothetical protein